MSDFLNDVLNATVATLNGSVQVAEVAEPAAKKPVPVIDKDYLVALFNHADRNVRVHAIGRALVVLFNNQTAGERANNQTRVTNGEGFTKGDARRGSISAKYYLENKKMSDKYVAFWAPRLPKYWRQLAEAAAQKAAR